jgi:hypothetical protein
VGVLLGVIPTSKFEDEIDGASGDLSRAAEPADPRTRSSTKTAPGR